MPRPEGSPRQPAAGAGVGLLEPDESAAGRSAAFPLDQAPSAPSPSAMAQLAGFETYEAADTTSVRDGIPMFNGRVVYLGSRTNVSITMPGSDSILTFGGSSNSEARTCLPISRWLTSRPSSCMAWGARATSTRLRRWPSSSS